MRREPTKRRRVGKGGPRQEDVHAQAIRFMLNVINATIYSSGDDYEGAVVEFFPQLQALGHLIGARDLEDVSEFLRIHSRL